MSHVVAIQTEFKDLPAIQAACKELGLTFKHGQKTFRWFGRWMNDYDAKNAAYNLGIKPEDYGKCEHAIEVPGSGYDIGLVKNAATGAYKAVFDFYGTGRVIQDKVGAGCEKLVQRYALCKMEAMAKQKGHVTQREQGKDGKIVLRVRANRF